ncbi:MAG: alpha/beta hydrolase [Azoarcus sp.]|jgi:acetyl esterase|nr:alpha/beta hydrolase [Azoarcus sp.]
MALTEQARWLLSMIYRVGAPRFHEFSPEQARRSFLKLQRAFCGPAPELAAVENFFIPRGGDGDGMPVRLYRPQSVAGERLPLCIFYHGGGWCVGDLDSHDVLCRQLAHLGACAVLAVGYRLAPEHPFPAAPDDAWLALEWVKAEGAKHGIDPQRLALCGDSAGGTLAIVTTLAMRDAGQPPPRLLLLIYPCTEIGAVRPSRQRYGHGHFLDGESLEWFFAHYQANPFDWRASPMCASSLAGLPPVFLLAAECDPVVDEGAAFVDRVLAEGGEAERFVMPGMIHGFVCLRKVFPEADDAVIRLAASLKARLIGHLPASGMNHG